MERSLIFPNLPTPASVGAADRRSRRVLIEMIMVMALTVIPSLIWPQTKSLLAFLPIVYVLVERQLRHRPWATWASAGAIFGQALAANWHLFLLVAVVSQAITVAVALLFWPALLEHVRARIPMLDMNSLAPLLCHAAARYAE